MRDDLTLLRDLGADLEHEPPATLARQRHRLIEGARPRRRLPLLAVVTAAFVVAALALVPAVLRTGNDEPAAAPASAPLTVLLLGLDGGRRADSIALARVPADGSPAQVVSLPRDLRLGARPTEAKCGTSDRLGAVAGSGLDCAVRAVQLLTKVPVDHAFALDFRGFRALVDSVGGVDVTVPHAVDDPKSGLRLAAGTHRLDGERALAYARTRRGLGDGGDLERIERRHRLLAALAVRAQERAKNPVRLARLAAAFAGSAQMTGGPGDVERIANTLMRSGPDRVRYSTAPVVPDGTGLRPASGFAACFTAFQR
ncbi:LCP family protein [Actinomadura flavalba]|uniref:LCP family protein n=1 Tax=Actinomadura flavalba TaxID=1120938 RepID=UPI000361824D|nr:LCP family protein [Actinomadura flavalba]